MAKPKTSDSGPTDPLADIQPSDGDFGVLRGTEGVVDAPGAEPIPGDAFAGGSFNLSMGEQAPATATRPRKPLQAKPKPVRFQYGELVTLNAVEIAREELKEILADIDDAVDYATASEHTSDQEAGRVRAFLNCLCPPDEIEVEHGGV